VDTLSRAEPISPDQFSQLHPSSEGSSEAIIALLQRLQESGAPLRRGVNRKVDAELATIRTISSTYMLLEPKNLESTARRARDPIFLNATLDGVPFFFVVEPLGARNGLLQTSLPGIIYRAERRDRARRLSSSLQRVLIGLGTAQQTEASVADSSPDGLALELPDQAASGLSRAFDVEFLDGDRAGERARAEIRHSASLGDRQGWVRLGLSVTRAPVSSELEIERRREIVARTARTRARDSWTRLAGGLRFASSRAFGRGKQGRTADSLVDLISYKNGDGEEIRALINSWGETTGAPIVVIPPAWGKTKETLLPLALTIVESFRRAGTPVSVLRFDGIRRRGESHNERDCRFPGSEYHKFTFSQGIRDIQATLDFLHESPRFQPSTVVVVTFSAASVDGRRAIAAECAKRIGGWISVVGAPDLQSAMRVVSGGVDYLGGFERGIRFGMQEVQGVTVDMDHAAADAIDHRLAFLEDARIDMSRINVPVSWIYGQFDAWMDLERVRMLMSVGETSNRRLLSVPTGHQLRSSREALEVFRLVAEEVARVAIGKPVKPRYPDLIELEARNRAERSRLPKPAFDRDRFWRDYLIGRNGLLGIELMAATSAYAELMGRQIELLAPKNGERIADLGSGTGTFVLQLSTRPSHPSNLAVTEIDCVRDALRRARDRIAETAASHGWCALNFLRCDLDPKRAASGIPIRSGSYDGALASLLLSYVEDPEGLLFEIRRVLRPGGRVVLSTLRPDADTSRIYIEGAEELRRGKIRRLFGPGGEAELSASLRSFLNDAARLLDLEERGVFRFWDAESLSRVLRRAGFREIEIEEAFGDPPQALVVRATKH
jgi:ubiquinone/menaquinone biosynthesis C-methylase UbiE/dienelactone hydrolase